MKCILVVALVTSWVTALHYSFLVELELQVVFCSHDCHMAVTCLSHDSLGSWYSASVRLLHTFLSLCVHSLDVC